MRTTSQIADECVRGSLPPAGERRLSAMSDFGFALHFGLQSGFPLCAFLDVLALLSRSTCSVLSALVVTVPLCGAGAHFQDNNLVSRGLLVRALRLRQYPFLRSVVGDHHHSALARY